MIRFHKDNVPFQYVKQAQTVSTRWFSCMCFKCCYNKAFLWNLWDVKAAVKMGVAQKQLRCSLKFHLCVTDDPLTAGYIILNISHMTSFKGT